VKPHQRALPSGHPLGLFAPDPGMLTHPSLACGREGLRPAVCAVLTGLPKAGQAGRDTLARQCGMVYD